MKNKFLYMPKGVTKLFLILYVTVKNSKMIPPQRVYLDVDGFDDVGVFNIYTTMQLKFDKLGV